MLGQIRVQEWMVQSLDEIQAKTNNVNPDQMLQSLSWGLTIKFVISIKEFFLFFFFETQIWLVVVVFKNIYHAHNKFYSVKL